MQTKQIKEALEVNANSKCKKYLLNEIADEESKQTFSDLAASTIAMLGDLDAHDTIFIEDVEYDIEEYQMPNTELKTIIESTKVYWNMNAVAFKKPIIVAGKMSQSKGKLFTPKELQMFFHEYYSYLGKSVELTKVQKNEGLTIVDIHSFRAKEKSEGIILNGGSLLSERVCMLNELTMIPEINLQPYVRNNSWAGKDNKSQLIGLL